MSKNFAYSTVATAPSPATSGTSLVVAAGEGTRFYVGKAFIAPASTTPTPANSEVVNITAISTDTLTITRAQESSAARTVTTGDQIYQGPTAAMWDALVFPLFGDGADGDVTISSNTTLTRDMAYNNLTISSAAALNVSSYRVHVKGTLTVGSSCRIHSDGNSPTGGLRDIAGTGGTFGALGNGGLGGTSTTTNGGGGASPTTTNATWPGTTTSGAGSGQGGAGGAGSGGSAGSAGSVLSLFNAANGAGLPAAFPTAFHGAALNRDGTARIFAGGTGGGAGGGDGTNKGSAGAGGGGVCIVNARFVVNDGTISAKGGAAVSPVAGNCGAGGGGGGGVVIVNCLAYSGSGSVSAAGGAGASGIGTGSAGSAGQTGYALTNTWTAVS